MSQKRWVCIVEISRTITADNIREIFPQMFADPNNPTEEELRRFFAWWIGNAATQGTMRIETQG